MRRLMAILLFLPLSALAQTPVVPEIPFDSVPDFIKLPPDMFLGEAAGVAVNKAGNVFIFSRGNTTGPAYAAAAAQLLEFKPDGTYLREVGHNLYAWSFAHSVKIDPQDNIWAADKGSDMVIKFTPAGRVAMVFGRKQEASDEDTGPVKHPKPPAAPIDGWFRQVTDVAWDAAGNGYISDGYINSRVAKVSPDGTWLGSFGTPGNGPLQFNTPHSIAVDQQDNIYVADRGNGRIQVLDTSGKFLRQIVINVPVPPGSHAAIGPTPDINGIAAGYGGTTKTMAPGSPWAICITPGPHQVMYASDAYPGRIYKLALDGTVLGVLGRAGKQLKEFGWIHQIACPSENEIYVAELLNWRIQKLELHPAP
ncbi:peptidyl-alpha-hydroxyglycine alpha-amidating lyase family protein [Acidisphaera sp. L21]|uniref:peptidyl-alpha-hydroxyglycine alpha-amidating lyase family protein n=1 Tax=Acidisphaera sp. L21 TaxID=1641851 RepID=UPI00131AA5F4|nr:peptidyl-alpha-hydroxyglycine alpha-amidating lyase family protein [Acidisphaera sp. L21]